MMNVTLFGCAGTYLYHTPTEKKVEPKKTERKVEAVSPPSSGKRFDSYMPKNHSQSQS